MYPYGQWTPFEPPESRSRRRLRRIFYIKEEREQVDWSRFNLKQFGCRPVRYLKHIGAVVGEFSHSRWEKPLHHWEENNIHSEPDIQVKIGVPQLGQVFQSPRGLPWGIERIEAPRAWPVTMGKGVRVAIIDTGICYDHPALSRNYRGGVNILSPLFSPYDYNGHGTHVAGTIAARKNPTGIIGVAPRAQLYAVKAFNRKGTANLSDLLTAINWCIDHRMQIVNMSFGMNSMSDALNHAIKRARSQGIVMVAAAGNKGEMGTVDYPARYPETIAVTATGKNDQLASFSNIGNGVRLAAPGEKVISSWSNGMTRELSGTSMAVPHVAGTAALLLEMSRDLTPGDVETIMHGSSMKVSGLVGSGIGMVNAFNAVQMLGR